MKIRFHSNIEKFLNFCHPFLVEREPENNLLFGILNTLKQNYWAYSEKESPVLISVTDNHILKLISVRTPPFNQIISYTNDMKTIPLLVNTLSGKRVGIPGILGFKEGALKFAKLWAEKNSKKYSLEMNERIYLLNNVNPSLIGLNDFETAKVSDKNLVCEWYKAFILEIFPNTSLNEIKNGQKRMILYLSQNMVYILKVKGKIVSMAKKAGITPNGQTINAVYTPPNLRRRGYATELVAKLSQTILDEGKKYCFLFTDLKNPTSNKIYKKIGYKPVIDIDVYKFT